MRVADAANLSRGDLLLCKRIGNDEFDPPTIVKFEYRMTKHRKEPARLWVIWEGRYLPVNVRDVELENPLDRIARI